MGLRTFIEDKNLPSEQLHRFFRGIGRKFAELPLEEFDDNFNDFKMKLARHADTELCGDDRLELYREVYDLLVALRKKRLEGTDPTGRRRIRATYDLGKSFLSDAEINLAILKALHTPMTQQQVADDVLRCTRNAIGTRLSALQNGFRLGDMQVKIASPCHGQYGSTVHPILLPLNLTEVYVLLSVLGEAWSGKDDLDPHAVIARDLAEKIYFQLTDYAREKIDARLEECGAKPEKGEAPWYDFETYPAGDGKKMTKARRSRNWMYLEKSRRRVCITLACGDAEAGDDEHGEKSAEAPIVYGRLAPGKNPAFYLKDKSKNPAFCFVVELDDGSLVSLSWEDVVDIEEASE